MKCVRVLYKNKTSILRLSLLLLLLRAYHPFLVLVLSTGEYKHSYKIAWEHTDVWTIVVRILTRSKKMKPMLGICVASRAGKVHFSKAVHTFSYTCIASPSMERCETKTICQKRVETFPRHCFYYKHNIKSFLTLLSSTSMLINAHSVLDIFVRFCTQQTHQIVLLANKRAMVKQWSAEKHVLWICVWDRGVCQKIRWCGNCCILLLLFIVSHTIPSRGANVTKRVYNFATVYFAYTGVISLSKSEFSFRKSFWIGIIGKILFWYFVFRKIVFESKLP